MKNVLQIELNKAIKTRYFAISIIIGTMIGIVGLEIGRASCRERV